MIQTVIFPALDSGNNVPRLGRVQCSWAAVIIGALCLALLLSFVGVSPAMAETPAPCITVLVIPLQEASITYADGSRQTVQVEGEIRGQAYGSASGTIEITAAGELVERLTASRWSDVITDENGGIVRANLLARTDSSDADVLVTGDLSSYSSSHFDVGGEYIIQNISGSISVIGGY